MQYNVSHGTLFIYLGHSSFTLRSLTDIELATTKSVSMLQVTSEQCDDEISEGLPTSDTFQINGDSYFVECLNGDADLCQVYMQVTETFNLKNIFTNTTFVTSNNQTQRRLLDVDDYMLDSCDSIFAFYINNNPYQCGFVGLTINFDSKIALKSATLAYWPHADPNYVRLYTKETKFNGRRSFFTSVERLHQPAGYCPKGYWCTPHGNNGYRAYSSYIIIGVIGYVMLAF